VGGFEAKKHGIQHLFDYQISAGFFGRNARQNPRWGFCRSKQKFVFASTQSIIPFVEGIPFLRGSIWVA